MMKFKDLIPLIPTVDVIEVWERNIPNIVYKDTFKRYVDMELYSEWDIVEIKILGTSRIMLILED